MSPWKMSVIFLLLILTIGAVSASDDISEDIIASNNDDSMEIADGDIDDKQEITQEQGRLATTILNWLRILLPLREHLT